MLSKGDEKMKKFEGWRTEELQFVATLIAGRDMLPLDRADDNSILYQEIIREIRNRRIKDELGQLTLELNDREDLA
jgi:hypothetical protein